MTKSGLTLEERMRHAKAQIESGMSQEEYAKSVGFPTSTIGYWVKRYNDKKKKNESYSTDLVKDELSDMRSQILALTHVRDELMAKLENVQTKYESLQNVIVILGHQVGDE